MEKYKFLFLYTFFLLRAGRKVYMLGCYRVEGNCLLWKTNWPSLSVGISYVP